MSELSCKVKGQPRPLELNYSHCLNRLNISSENNDIGYHSFQKYQLFKKIAILMHKEANLALTFSRSRSI